MRSTKLQRWGMTVLFLGSAIIGGRGLEARSGGISGRSGNPATSGGSYCTACHSGGQVPTVTITGPTVVAPSSISTYQLRIVKPSGPNNVAGGLDVSATAGALSVVDSGTRLLNSEIVHDSPRVAVGGQVTWTFNWTAPATPGTATLYGAGNAVNDNSNTNGDNAAATSLAITVGAPATPGESSGPTLSPLLVSAFDDATGELTLTFGTACETTDNNLYYGPLGQVATYGWSGQVCGIGTGGVHAGFDPGPGSYFFVVVGTKNATEGSYGRSFDPVGGSAERPPYAGNICGQTQSLAQACDALP